MIVDSYTPTKPSYECPGCGYRDHATSDPLCPDCGGQLSNIAVARE
ncbi:rubrerythrin-like domain-containing protein [Natronococcus sp.]|nr:rubrerythrin-like domain-containing protein [Natronococcus sp.]